MKGIIFVDKYEREKNSKLIKLWYNFYNLRKVFFLFIIINIFKKYFFNYVLF